MSQTYRSPSDIYPSLTYDDAPAVVLDPEGHFWYFGTYRPGEYWESSVPT